MISLRTARRLFAAAVTGLTIPAFAIAQQPAAPPVPVPPAATPTPAPDATAILCSDCPAPTPPAPIPYAGPWCERPVLTGDWGGHRSHLRDHGITFNLYSTQFAQGVSSGGIANELEYGGRADYLLNIDGHKLGLWQGLFVDLHGETLYGRSANGLTGALLPVSIGQFVPTPNPVTALTGVKVTQALSENFVLFGGKINTLDGFNQPFTGGARGVDGFMNLNMLFSPGLARTVPYSTFGGGFAVLKDMEPVLSVMALDPNNTPTVSGFDTFFNRGVSIVAAANVPTNFFGKPGHQGVIGTYSNSKYASLDGLPYYIVAGLTGQPFPRETGSWSVGYMFDQTIATVDCDPARRWGVFGNATITDGNPNPVRYFANIGVGGASPLRNRKFDSFGAGYFYAGLSTDFRNFAPRLIPLGDEHGVELFYNLGITPWCHLTSDIQFITPGRERIDPAVVYGMRLKIDF